MTSRGPLPDECISSWLDRELALHPRIERPTARHYHVNDGPMVHPDIRPRKLWLDQVATIFGIDPEELRRSTLWYLYPRLEAQYVCWVKDPYNDPIHEGRPRHRTDIRSRWCTRCLAEDMHEGRPGYIRRDWLLSVQTFCSKHAWPLAAHCGSCDRSTASFKFRQSRWVGPYCEYCGFPLTRSDEAALRAEAIGSSAWAALVDFETTVKDVVVRNPDRTVALGNIARRKFLAAYCDLFDILIDVAREFKSNLRGIDYFETFALPFHRVYRTQYAPRCHPMLTALQAVALRISATIGALFDESDVLPRLLFQRSRTELLGHLSWVYGFHRYNGLWHFRNRWPEKFLEDIEAAKPKMALDMELRNPKGYVEAISRYKRTGQIA